MQPKYLTILFGAAAGLVLGTSAMAATVTFTGPVAITTADATLNLPGTVTSATVFGGLATTNVTTSTQTIAFLKDGSGSPAATLTQGNDNGVSAAGGPVFSGDTGNATFNTVLGNFGYDGHPTKYQLNGLTPGTQYQVQVFALDDRANAGDRTITISDGTNSSASYLQKTNSYVLGTFTADGTGTQLLQTNGFGYPGHPEDTGSNINAVVVRAVPEPASAALLGLGSFGLLVRRRRGA